MPIGDLWNRTLVYFGIAEEDEDWVDEDGYATEEALEQSYSERPNVRRLTPRARSRDYDDWTDPEPAAIRSVRPSRDRSARPRPVEAVPNPASVRVHLVLPRSFNDAQQIADKVFLLTPRNVEVSAEERARLLEGGAFFNQA